MNVRLLLTAPAGYASRLLKAFEETGGREFYLVSRPMIHTDIDLDSSEFKSFLQRLPDFDYVAFSSRKAIEAFAAALSREHLSLPETLCLCAIGKDNELIGELLHVPPAFVAEEPSPMGIVRHLQKLPGVVGKRIAVLAPRVVGMEEPSVVPDFVKGLTAVGMEPFRVNVYRTQAASVDVLEDTCQQILHQNYDAVVFTSGTEIKVFLQMIPAKMSKADFFKNVKVICYGPYTARCAAGYGVKVDFTSSAFGSFQELVAQIHHFYDGSF